MTGDQLRRRLAIDWLDPDDVGCDILHVDMDAFFASVELLRRPDLVGKPVIVGGRGNRSVVLSATYEARAVGVHSAMPVYRARRLCPAATVIEPSPGLYGEMSAQVMRVLGDFSPIVAVVSVDEAFVDVSGAYRSYGSATQIGERIRGRIRSELGLPCSVGISARTHIAKIASSAAKPDGLLVVPISQQREFLRRLPIGRLWGVGQRVEEKLATIGIRTVAQLLDIEPRALESYLGKSATAGLLALAQGRECRPIGSKPKDRSIGCERTFGQDSADIRLLELEIGKLAGQAAVRLRQAGLVGSRLTLKIKYWDWRTISRSSSLDKPTDATAVIAEVAVSLLRREVRNKLRGPVRLVGVRMEQLRKLEEIGKQLTLDGAAEKRWAEDRAVDEIARRYGRGVLVPASRLLPKPHDRDGQYRS